VVNVTKIDPFAREEGRIYIEKESLIPYYHQLKVYILNQIESEKWPPNEKIPSEAGLCAHFKVSRTVVRQALKELENEGYLTSRKGKGTFVAGPKIVEGLVQNLSGFTEDMTKRGYRVTNTILEQRVVPAPKPVSKHLEIDVDSPVVQITRVRNLNGEPVALSTTFVPESRCPGLAGEDLSTRSLYDLFENKYGLKIFKGHRFIGACLAAGEAARLLKVDSNTPLIEHENVSYLEDGRPLEYFHALHRGDVTKFEVTIWRARKPDDRGAG
jgi:GntR family transcriptional regulator